VKEEDQRDAGDTGEGECADLSARMGDFFRSAKKIESVYCTHVCFNISQHMVVNCMKNTQIST